MASHFPRSPKLVRGALVAYPPGNPRPWVLPFQYNPETLTRRVEHRSAAQEPETKGEGRRYAGHGAFGPPAESIDVKIELDATDFLEAPALNAAVAAAGLHPVLAALEGLLYPPTEQLREQRVAAEAGRAQLKPLDLPLVILAWGPARVVPVRLNSISVTEEAFDQVLNPIRASVDLSMSVLTLMDFEPGSPGYQAYMASLKKREGLALAAPGAMAQSAIGTLTS